MPCIPFSLIPPVGKGLEPGRTPEVSAYTVVAGTSHPGTTGKLVAGQSLWGAAYWRQEAVWPAVWGRHRQEIL